MSMGGESPTGPIRPGHGAGSLTILGGQGAGSLTILGGQGAGSTTGLVHRGRTQPPPQGAGSTITPPGGVNPPPVPTLGRCARAASIRVKRSSSILILSSAMMVSIELSLWNAEREESLDEDRDGIGHLASLL